MHLRRDVEGRRECWRNAHRCRPIGRGELPYNGVSEIEPEIGLRTSRDSVGSICTPAANTRPATDTPHSLAFREYSAVTNSRWSVYAGRRNRFGVSDRGIAATALNARTTATTMSAHLSARICGKSHMRSFPVSSFTRLESQARSIRRVEFAQFIPPQREEPLKEGAPLAAENLAFKQGVGNRRAILRYESALPALGAYCGWPGRLPRCPCPTPLRSGRCSQLAQAAAGLSHRYP